MAYAAVLGYGVVGSGVVRALTGNADLIAQRAGEPIEIKKILDLREFPGDPMAGCVTREFGDIANDDAISVVAEAMGGVEPAYTYTKTLLQNGKSVVTSNKELVAAHGVELLDIARKNGANYLFEGAVCGGIPIIRTVYGALTADRVLSVAGIMNGTTNYILTKMGQGGSFDAALAEAQELGYAEKDPTNDVQAYDPCRKLAILLSLFTGKLVDYNDIYTEGITNLTPEDWQYVNELSGEIKLIAYAKLNEPQKGIEAWVAPAMVSAPHPLKPVYGVFNAVFLDCDVTGQVMLYGSGAGQMPTGGAVAADVIEAVKAKGKPLPCRFSGEKQAVLTYGETPVRKLIRVAFTDKIKAADLIYKHFEVAHFSEIIAGELGFMTQTMNGAAVNAGINALNAAGVKVINQIMVCG